MKYCAAIEKNEVALNVYVVWNNPWEISVSEK